MIKLLFSISVALSATMAYSQNTDVQQTPENKPAEKGLPATDGTLRVATTGSITIFKGASLTANSDITNLGNGRNFTVESDAGLIQTNSAVNTGNIAVKREIEVGAPRTQYNYIGSPVTFAAAGTLKTIYPGIDYVLYHNQANNKFYNSTGTNIPGRGLAVKEPNLSVGGPAREMKVMAEFFGVPQTGDISIGIVNTATANTALGYNLVANPYPSNIDLIKLYNLNGGNTLPGAKGVSTFLSATFYFWDNEVNNGVALTQQGSDYNGQAYAVFNALTGNSGTGTAAAGYLAPGQPKLGNKTPTNIVKVSQGFMVKSLVSSYNFKFTDAIRTAEDGGPAYFGRPATQDDRYWLQMISPTNLVNTIAIVHFEGGSNGLGAEDSESRGGSDELYSPVNGMRAAINGRASFSDSDVVALGSRHYQSGMYRIALSEKEGRFANGQNIYLKDRQTGITTNLSHGEYIFAAEAGDGASRFEIVYKPGGVLGTDAPVKESLHIFRERDLFTVKSSADKITALQLFDSSGRLVYTSAPNGQEAVIDASALTMGVYIIKIDRGSNMTSRKIIK